MSKFGRALIVLGSAGVGKGTQSRLLERFGFHHLDLGHERRRAVEKKTPVGLQIEALGDLVSRKQFYSDELATALFREALDEAHSKGYRKFVLDGYPRNLSQLASMNELLQLDAAVMLHAPFDVLVRRTDGRLLHSESGRTYHPVENPPRVSGYDDITGEPLVSRQLSATLPPDDALRTRMELEASEMGPLVQELERSGKLTHIDRNSDIHFFAKHRQKPKQLHDTLCDVLRLSDETPVRRPGCGSKQPLRKVGIIGLGPMAQRIYYPILQRLAQTTNLTIPIVMDVEEKRESISHFIKNESPACMPGRQVYLSASEETHHVSNELNAVAKTVLNDMVGELDGLIIATEPSARAPYVRWALEQGIPALIDKPPILPNPFDPCRITPEFDDLLELANNSSAHVHVCVQRRMHPGYQFVHRLLSDFVAEWQVPISFMDIYHGDGMWCMPGELVTRKNHPYIHGYGKLVHSGYHFLDLFTWMRAINTTNVRSKTGDHLDVTLKHFGAKDLRHMYTQKDLEKLVRASPEHIADSIRTFETMSQDVKLGEINVHALAQYSDIDGHVECIGSLNLLQNSFSRRHWFHPREDVYKGNGRVRHEKFVANVGALLSVHVDSYQSHEVNQPDKATNTPSHAELLLSDMGLAEARSEPGSIGGLGCEHHFDVSVFRNVGAVGGPAMEHFSIGDTMRMQNETNPAYLGHNEEARVMLVNAFIANHQTPSLVDLQEQRDTMYLLEKMYKLIS